LAFAVAFVACFRGDAKDVTQPTGVIGPTGGGGGGGGTTDDGTYDLVTVNDTSVPYTLANDSVSGVGDDGDTTRVFIASIDSAFLYLNSDLSAEETDYLTVRDARTASDSSFDRTISFGDTSYGAYSVTGSTVLVNLTDTISGEINVSYSASGSTLTGTVAYILYNTDNQIAAAGNATYEFGYLGAPLSSRVGTRTRIPLQRGPRVEALTRSAVAGHVRVWRPPVGAAARRPLTRAPARTRP
jgi:hypothetical protein